ncbi:MAG: HEPN domain-containing protein [Gammaproteobacteria bacterium]|nr:HEPN domain-containing protein [Gammaproteobacteria bacterium]
MRAIDSFRLNISRARELGELYKALSAITTTALSIDDLLRSQIVMSVSAVDHYIHEVVRQGMIAIYEGSRPAVPGFSKFQVSLSEAKNSIPTMTSDWVDSAIRQSHSFLSFQHPDKLADAIRLVHADPLWPALEIRMSLPARDIKEQLKLIVDRRNKIAHEADIDPSYPGTRWPIAYSDSVSTTDFLVCLVESIEAEVA